MPSDTVRPSAIIVSGSSGPALRSTMAVVTPGEGVDGADREVDATRDDDHRRADRHDREEAGVGRRLDEGVGIEEVVDRQPRARVNVRAGKDAQHAPEEQNHEHEPRLRGRQRSFEHQRPPSISRLRGHSNGTLNRDSHGGHSTVTVPQVNMSFLRTSAADCIWSDETDAASRHRRSRARRLGSERSVPGDSHG